MQTQLPSRAVHTWNQSVKTYWTALIPLIRSRLRNLRVWRCALVTDALCWPRRSLYTALCIPYSVCVHVCVRVCMCMYTTLWSVGLQQKHQKSAATNSFPLKRTAAAKLAPTGDSLVRFPLTFIHWKRWDAHKPKVSWSEWLDGDQFTRKPVCRNANWANQNYSWHSDPPCVCVCVFFRGA